MKKKPRLRNNYRISGLFMEILKKYAEEKNLLLETEGNHSQVGHTSAEDFSAAFASVANHSGDEDFGLHLGERFYSALSGGVLAGLQANSPDIGQAIANLCRYHNLMGDYFQLHFDRDLSRGILAWQLLKNGDPLNRHMVEGILCHVALSLKRLANGELRFAEVRFSHPCPHSTQEHRRLFGCRCCFDQPENALVLKAQELKRPVFLADPTLFHKLERIALKVLKELSQGDWTRRSMQSIHGGLQSGAFPTLATVAAELAVSQRLLQNKLKREGTTFRTLLDQVRKETALAYVRTSDMSLFDIAYLLGFADQSAFNHAFRRWTGVHPGKYKNKNSH